MYCKGKLFAVWLAFLLTFGNVSSSELTAADAPTDASTADTITAASDAEATADAASANGDTCDLCSGAANCTCDSETVQYSGLTSLDLLPTSLHTVTLELHDCDIPLLNVTELQRMPGLQLLRITNCNVQQISGEWRHPNLTELDLSHNAFDEFELHWLDGLADLRSLNLSGNPLRSVSPFSPVESRIRTLDLRGKRWNCTEHTMTWLVEWLRRPAPRRLVGDGETRCAETRKQYLTMDGRRLLDVLRLTQVMLEQCPSAPPFGCACDLIQVDSPTHSLSAATYPRVQPESEDGTLYAVIVEVYCDGRGLTEFPPGLPDNTTTLYIRNNSLTDFGPVIGNRSGYQSLTALYLDGNLLEAEDANRLEGSDFIHRFSILSLSRNRLQTLPLYAFDNAFGRRSFNVDSLFLGGNPWLCDCDSAFTFSFRTWLASQHKLIRDRSAIRCGSGPLATGPDGPPLLTLSRRKLCGRLQINWWDLAIGLLATAVAALALKFAYDVTVYRRTGALPLVVRKLPW